MRSSCFGLILLFPFVGAANDSAVSAMTQENLPELVALYEHLHSHPELSFREEKTAARLVSELEPLGFSTTTKVGGHGFVAVMENGEGPTVMVRTDLDALPVVEDTGRSYSSDVRDTDDYGQDVGVMHACAHDIHMTSFVGTARNLARLKDSWKGTLIMIGQPAEERGAGAREMLADGLFERFPRPDHVVGLHVSAALPSGTVGYRPGFAFANVDSVDITIRGVGGHGAYPHKTKDPIVIAARTVLALQTIMSREVDPVESGVVTVGSIHGGAKHNIISDEVKLQLTVRSYKDETRAQILDAIRRVTLHTARAAGLPSELEPTVEVLEQEFTPATYNDPALGGRLLAVWKRALGEEHVVEVAAQMGGEDFSRFGREEPRIPIFMLWLGTIDAERWEASRRPGAPPLPSLHSPFFWPEPKPTIETGVRAMTAAALELLQ